MKCKIKLVFDEEQLARLQSLPMLNSVLMDAPRTEHMSSIYFDTADFALHRCSASLRVRTIGNERIQTLQVAGSVRAGLFEREELECPLAGKEPDIGAFTALASKHSSAAKLLRAGRLAGALKPIFTTRITRFVLQLRLSQGDEIELAVDVGTVDTGVKSAPVNEIEIELKSGKDHLYQFAQDLLIAVPMRISHAAKGERGYALLGRDLYEPVHAAPLKLKNGQSIEAAFQAIALNCLAQIQSNELGVVSAHESSSVHQMRIGLRRLRSACDLFKERIQASAIVQGELKWIAGELGKARDWEVLADSTLPRALAAVTRDTDVDSVVQAVRAIARHNRQRAAAAVNSVRYTRLMMQLTQWLKSSGWRAGLSEEQRAALNMSVMKFASRTLRQRHRRLLKRGHNLADLDAHSRHRARIAGKKLRYAVEFFASLYSKHAVHDYLAALADLQDELGWRNDATVADGLLKSMAAEQPAVGVASGYARGYLASRIETDHDVLSQLWKTFRRLSPPH